MDLLLEMSYAEQMQISSASNEKIKQAKRVREGRVPGLIFIEGLRLCEEAVRSGLVIETVFYLSEAEVLVPLIQQLQGQQATTISVSPEIMRSLGDTVHGQGIVMLAQRPAVESTQLPTSPSSLLLGLDRLQDPGNVGTLLRTAEAAGVHAVVSLKGCADVFSPKVLRSAMGSAFRLPIFEKATSDDLTGLQSLGLQIVAAAGDGEMDYCEYAWHQPTLLLLGNEGSGVAPELMKRCDVRLRIPMHAGVESLNVAAAGAIMLFEAARQRRAPRSHQT